MFSNNCECECDQIWAAKISNLSLSDVFFKAPNTSKLGWTGALDTAGGAHDAPLDTLASWEG